MKDRLLELAQQRSVDSLLKFMVNGAASRPHVALARIWLIDKGDLCDTCHLRKDCPEKIRCLHTVASAGRSISNPTEDWSRVDSEYCRIPLGFGNIGTIPTTGREIIVKDVQAADKWIGRENWVRKEGIRGFVGEPIIYKGEVLGTLAVFTRTPVAEEAPKWLRIFADHAATAIVNARAFEEIERLKAQLELENTYLREEIEEQRAYGEIVGSSPALRHLVWQIELVAPTEANVLILGESGTGKELVAREIHLHSNRNKRPMIRVNCASIPKELYESEFFGHAKGAFTGALKDRAGRFEAADGGTLFLDEVGEIPLELQSKLLRVLQEKQYERVGEEKTRHVDVRIIAATNRNLKREVEAGRFRQDLYYRLNVFPIEVAPLRDRKEDIPALATHFLDLAAKKLNVPKPRLTQANLLKLQGYDWPGNVRELQNVIERAVIIAQKGILQFDLPGASSESERLAPALSKSGINPEIVPEAEMLRRERENMIAALKKANWKVSGRGGAAELLGVRPTTLATRMQAMKIRKPRE
ncbi:sigma-54-dependent Fis family transcriptional regulator [Pedosphaera parvula]|uniref:Transcriptional regulator, NifA subfamily, Fis Family n=1 Tax=Pedosphaera parvula (strain Ellin514) TaxID=320771 RepID=B9XF66_PEDPL|nr:sigma 54-interacting transcriptional regulator [Pedosphaera parvula]EEF61564.1 transcriptional regulator, NifA subfamily, Fis Family [Pedosphaera parvula Ellin514]